MLTCFWARPWWERVDSYRHGIVSGTPGPFVKLSPTPVSLDPRNEALGLLANILDTVVDLQRVKFETLAQSEAASR